ncbi:MAG TPA: pyridoxal-phosphate dependent enzyme [Candidatus Limnocylindria bacterium]|jgi:threonine dehydratase
MAEASLAPVSLADARAASQRIAGIAMRTPLLRLEGSKAPTVHLKLENMQPVGSFKLRGAANSVAMLDGEDLARGIGTASAGNMGRAIAWLAHRHGIPCTVVVPDDAPAAKVEPVRALGATIVPEPFARWWQALVEGAHPAMGGTFLSPFASEPMMAGNATIGLEIVEELPEIDAVVVPYGGGGLSAGIACAVHALRPEVPVYAAEVQGAAPLAAALGAGKPVEIEMQRTFVDGIGSTRVVDAMWPLVSRQLAGSLVVSLDEVSQAVRILATSARVIAEGAGAVALAAARAGGAGTGHVAVVVSGGNIDPPVLAQILQRG